MYLFEVKVPLDGYTMSVLMASPDEATAKSEVAKQLREVSEPRAVGDAIRYNWSLSEMTAEPVVVTPAA